ncbi:cation-transporting P-type ATPase [Clostridium carnis]
MRDYYSNTWVKVVDLLGSSINKGLYEYDCEIRRTQYGDNRICLPYSGGKLNILKGLLKQKYIYFILTIIILFAIRGFNSLAIITGLLLILSVSFKIYFEIVKEKEVEILQNLNTSQVLVLREGIERLIEAEELVKGDIVYFRKNSFISADIRIIESKDLKVDERSITGDSFLKDKYETKVSGYVGSIGDINNMLFRGSIIKDGQGKGIVVETGNNTQLGKLLRVINTVNVKKHTMIQRVENIASKVGICLILTQVILGLILPEKLISKEAIFAYGIFSILSICTPIIILEYVKIIKGRFKDENIEIINFSTIDLVKDVKVMFLDKVGTLTKNELYVEKVYTNEEIIGANKLDVNDINVKRLLDISILCNNAKYNNDSKWSKGDMFEIAYVKFGLEKSLFKGTIESKNKRKFEMPRDTNRKLITTVNKNRKGYRANTRGNLDSILEVSTHVLVNGIERELTNEDILKIKMADMNFSREGLVTEALAYRSFNYEPSEQENIESNLVFVGLIALENPFVEGITEEIEELMGNKVLPIIFTDDNKITGEVLGRKLNLISSSEEVISGIELSYLSEEEFCKVISKTRVFCRLTPELKTKIVSLFNKDGFKVAVEGETLGDLPLVSLAQVGIVKGKASSLLKRSGDIYTNESAVKAFIKLLKENIEMDKSIVQGITIYVLVMLSQIFALNFHYLFTESILFNEYTTMVMNFLLLTPIILLNMCFGKEESSKKSIIRGALFISIPIIGIFLVKDHYEFIACALIGGISLLTTIINCRISYRSFNNGVRLLFIAIIIYGVALALIGFMTSVVYSQLLGILIGGLLLSFIVGDIIIKKWQES